MRLKRLKPERILIKHYNNKKKSRLLLQTGFFFEQKFDYLPAIFIFSKVSSFNASSARRYASSSELLTIQ